MKKIIGYIVIVMLALQVLSVKASAKDNTETKAINYVYEYIRMTSGYTVEKKDYSYEYEKQKNGNMLIEVRDKNDRTPAFYMFKKKYKLNRLYKLNLDTAKYEFVQYYSIKGKKGSKALASKKARTELKKAKKLAPSGKTAVTKSVKIGTPYKDIQKILGTPKKVHAPIKNVVYEYPKASISILSDFSSEKSDWVPAKNSKVVSIDVKTAKNKTFAFKDIQAVFGKNYYYTSYGHSYGYQTLSYTFKNYTIVFYSTIYDTNNARLELGLGSNVLFDHYVVQK